MMLPVSICAAGAHASSVFALGAGAVSFAQIVKVWANCNLGLGVAVTEALDGKRD